MNDFLELELQLCALIDMSTGEFFCPQEWSKKITRDELHTFLRDAVRKSINLYRRDFAIGMRKKLAESHLRDAVVRNE